MIEFAVPGKPVGKERPRKGNGGKFYTPQKTKDYERYIAQLALIARNQAKIYKPTEDFVRIDIIVCVNNKKRPDIDNIGKIILDAMNNVIYTDDYQVVGLHADIFYNREFSKLHIKIGKIENYYDRKPSLSQMF